MEDRFKWPSGGMLTAMTLLTDTVTASRVDPALILPVITWLEASCMLALSGVPAEVAARVLAEPSRLRRPEQDSPQ